MKGLFGAVALFAAQAGILASPLAPRATSIVAVDLGYAVYQGTRDANNSINIFKGYASIYRRTTG